MKHHTLFSIAFCVLTIAGSPSSRSQSLVEVRFIEDSLQPGVVEMKHEETQHMLYVGSEVFLSLKDLDSATTSTAEYPSGQPYYVVILEFHGSLTDSIRRLTGRNIGKRIAFVVAGKIVSAPTILNPLVAPMAALPVSTESEARELASKINAALQKK